MPFKNKADKDRWRYGYRAKQREYTRDWNRRRREADAPIIAARKEQRKAMASDRIASAMAAKEERRKERERIRATCSKCGEIKRGEFRVRNGVVTERVCHACNLIRWREYRLSHKPLIKAACKRLADRRKNDPVLLMKHRIRQRIQKAIVRMGRGVTVKPGKLRYLGCTSKDVVAILQRQFVKGMTWDNYGSAWHVDHVIPLAAFDLSREEGRRAAFHYTNLQPLWAQDNWDKNDKAPTNPHQPELLLDA